jgi:hypothetical protein
MIFRSIRVLHYLIFLKITRTQVQRLSVSRYYMYADRVQNTGFPLLRFRKDHLLYKCANIET